MWVVNQQYKYVTAAPANIGHKKGIFELGSANFSKILNLVNLRSYFEIGVFSLTNFEKFSNFCMSFYFLQNKNISKLCLNLNICCVFICDQVRVRDLISRNHKILMKLLMSKFTHILHNFCYSKLTTNV